MTRYTFLLPAYKAPFLGETLNSIIGQTYTDFNVIVSDDCSPEDLRLICKPYLEDSRFVYRRNEENMGSKSLVSHWNLLVDLCNTEYLILASDDDVYDKRFLENIDNLTIKYPSVNLFRARSCKINDIGELYAKDSLYGEYESSLEFVYSSFGQERIHCIGNYVFKTNALKSLGGFVDFPIAWFSDDATVLSCCLDGVVNTQDVLYSFRISQINISNSNRRDREIAKKKIDATCSFYEWMNNSFVDRISFPDTLYNRLLFKKVCERYRDRVRWQISSYYSQIDYKSFVILIKWMKKQRLFASYKDCILFAIRWINN